MRVLFISGGDSKYGAPRSMMTLMEELVDKFDIEPILLTKKHNELNDYCDEHNIQNYSFWYRDIMAGSPYSNKILTLIKHIVKYIAYIFGGITQRNISKLPIDFSSIDIVHTNTNRQDIGAYICRKYNLKHIWHIREMGKEDYNVIFYKRNCISYMNKNTEAFVMISDTVKKKWTGIGIDSQKSYVVYNGIDEEKVIKKSGETHDKVRIVITGHVQPNKGQLQLVQAIAELPITVRNRVELDIVGEAYGDYKKKIKLVIKENGIDDKVRFLGYQKNVNEILSQYDIGVTCSKAEGFGRCTVEYMLAGLLTIASDTGANSEIIQDKVTGILYHYNDIRQLSHSILWGIEHTSERKKIAVEGAKIASARFGRTQCAVNMYEVYKKCRITH